MNKQIPVAAALLAGAALASSLAQAAPPPAGKPAARPAAAPIANSGTGVGQGDFELSAFANVNSTDGETFTFLGTSLGYFYTDQVQLLAGVFGFVGSDISDVSIQLGSNYHFAAWKPQGLSNPMVPYVGASLTLGITEVPDGFGGTYAETNVDPAVRAGIKQFLGERISVGYELEHTLSDPASTELKLGLNFYF